MSTSKKKFSKTFNTEKFADAIGKKNLKLNNKN